MAPAVPSALPPGESQTAAASFRANPQGQPGIGPPPPTTPAERANFLAGGGNGSPYQAGSDAGGGPNRKLPRDLSSLAPGQVYKTIDPATGRTVYSGRDVRENANIVDAGGAKTGQLSNNLRGEGIQVLDGQGRVTDTRTPSSGFGQSGGFRANQPDNVPWPDMHIPSFADRHQSVVNGADGRALSGWAPGMESAMRRYGGAGDDRPNNLSPEQNRNVNELAGRFKAGEFSGGGAGDPAAGLRGRKADRANAFAMASMREQGENLRSQRQTDATMRGQDVMREGHILTNDAARIRLGYDMRRDKLHYDAGRSDVGFTQGQQAIKDLHQEIGGMLPPTRDDKGNPTPDTQNAARYATAIQATVGRLGGTMKDLTAPDKARFVAGMQLADVANATATNGLTPWGTRAIQSNEPILAIKRLANGDYQTNRVGVNGETEVIPKHYVEKEGSYMSFGGRATNKFTPLMEASNGAAR